MAWMMARYLNKPLHNISPTRSDVEPADVSGDIHVATIPDLDDTIHEYIGEIQVLPNSSCDMTCSKSSVTTHEVFHGNQQVPVWSAYNSD